MHQLASVSVAVGFCVCGSQNLIIHRAQCTARVFFVSDLCYEVIERRPPLSVSAIRPNFPSPYVVNQLTATAQVMLMTETKLLTVPFCLLIELSGRDAARTLDHYQWGTGSAVTEWGQIVITVFHRSSTMHVDHKPRPWPYNQPVFVELTSTLHSDYFALVTHADSVGRRG